MKDKKFEKVSEEEGSLQTEHLPYYDGLNAKAWFSCGADWAYQWCKEKEIQDLQKKLEIAREALKLRHTLPIIESNTTVGSFLTTISELWKKQDQALKEIEGAE